MDIDFIIAVRDRDNERIQRCIDSFKHVANKIFVVDYGSKKPIKVNDAEIIRYTKSKIWNKSHALNLGIKASNSEYICTIDCDIILSEEILKEIKKHLDKYTVIFNTNVRRIEKEDISKEYEIMLNKSKPWFPNNPRSNIYSGANGVIQVFSRDFINKIGGYDEGIGIYWGAMDNRIYEQARGLSMKIVDINYPMLHQEHNKQKEDNLSKKEKEFAQYARIFKIHYLNELISENNFISKRKWGGDLPNHDWMIEKVNEFKKVFIPKSKVFVAIITNFDSVPKYFMHDLISMISFAKKYGIEIVTFSMKGGGIDSLRNYAVDGALKSECTHLLQLDTDHRYPEDTIVRLLRHKKKFVCGVTNRCVPNFEFTQYKDSSVVPISSENNILNFTKPNGLVKIGSTGMVGSLIHMSVFSKISKPFYEFTFSKIKDKVYNTGEDINFCKKLTKAGINIWCDTEVSFPHQIKNAFIDRGNIVLQ